MFLKPHKAEGGSKKVSFVKAFHEGFNRNYEKLLIRYKKWTGFFINHKITAFGVVAASIVALAAMMMTTSTALVPNEDTGVLFCMVNMPPATSLDKTEATLAKVDKILAANPAVESRTEILGYSFIAGQGNTYGTFIIKLKDWSEREKGQDATSVLGQLYGAVGQQIKDATVMMFQPPMISGYSVTSGFELQLQDKTGGDINKFFQIYQQFIGALNQRPKSSRLTQRLTRHSRSIWSMSMLPRPSRRESARALCCRRCKATTAVCMCRTSTASVNFTV